MNGDGEESRPKVGEADQSSSLVFYFVVSVEAAHAGLHLVHVKFILK